MEMSNEERAEYMSALRARILAHPGRVAANRWDSIRLVHTALQWNEEFLVRYIDFSGPEGELRAIETMRYEDGRRPQMQQFWLFLFTFLANYTAMNSTLVDHVRGLLANYRGTPFAREEETRRKALGFAPVTQFVKDLRNYISHISAPPLSFHMAQEQGGPVTFEAQLNADTLIQSGRMGAASKQYLNGRDVIGILDAVREYAALRETYYSWLFEQFDVLHGDDVAAHDRLIEEQDAFYGRPSGPPSTSEAGEAGTP